MSKVLISGDFANVESRGGAWFAGEDWKLKVFREADAGTGAGVYEHTASRMFGLPIESIKNPSEERQWGKVCDLAFMYGGGVGSGKTMGKTYGVKATDEQWDEWKDLWRDGHPATAGVRHFNQKTGRYYRKGGIWKAVENAAISAVRDKGTPYTCGHPDRQATFKVAGSFLWCLLPSGRTICYPYPKILPGLYGPQLTYMTVPSQETRRKGKIIDDPKNASNWARVSTWGGTLFNNIVQGFCRDFLADGMLTLHRMGANIVLHTHDDINLEVDSHKAEGARAAMEGFMRTPPAWADGFPLFAKCNIMKRYGK